MERSDQIARDDYPYMKETGDLIEEMMTIPDMENTPVMCEFLVAHGDKIHEIANACRTAEMFRMADGPWHEHLQIIERDYPTAAERLHMAVNQLVVKLASAPTSYHARTCVLVNMPAVQYFLELYIGKTKP